MRVLVTGGAGYIGSQTCKALAVQGHEPITFDNLSEGHRWALQWGPLVEGDLSNGNLLRETIVAHDISAVIHFAAHAYVGESVENPRKYYRNNLVNTLNVLDAMVDTGVRSIVFSSSCAVYGVPQTLPLTEDHPLSPVNPYGDTKLAIERALRWYGSAYDLGWVALRYFNAAGADPEGQLGEEHDPETHLIPLALKAARDSVPLSVFGTDYPTPDGTAIRDYIHVADLAHAHVLALDHLSQSGESAAFNLGTGTGHSVREVVNTVERVTGLPVPLHEVGRRSGDPPALVADAARAGAVFGWQPECSDLESIVATAWAWQGLEFTSSSRPQRRDDGFPTR